MPDGDEKSPGIIKRLFGAAGKGARKVGRGIQKAPEIADTTDDFVSRLKPLAVPTFGLLIALWFFRGQATISFFILVLMGFMYVIFVIKLLHLEKFVTLSLIIVVLWFGLSFLAQGTDSGLWRVGTTMAADIGLDKVFGTVAASFSQFDPTSAAYNQDPFAPKIAEEQPKKGVRFYDIDIPRDTIESGEDIVIYGSAELIALTGDGLSNEGTDITFTCGITNGLYKLYDVGETYESLTSDRRFEKEGIMNLHGPESNVVTVYPQQDEDLGFDCTIENIIFPGYYLDNDGSWIPFLKDTHQDTVTLQVAVEAVYKDFTTMTSLRVYNTKQETIKTEGGRKKVMATITDSLNKNGKLQSQCVSGCAFTALALGTTFQPITEVGKYPLRVNLRKDKDFYGDILSLTSLEVRVPEGDDGGGRFELTGCKGFGPLDDTSHAVLDKSDVYLQDVNEELAEDDYAIATDFSFDCNFIVVDPYEKKGKFSEIYARATYDYMVDMQRPIFVQEDLSVTEEQVPQFDEGSSVGDGYYGDYVEGDSIVFAE